MSGVAGQSSPSPVVRVNDHVMPNPWGVNLEQRTSVLKIVSERLSLVRYVFLVQIEDGIATAAQRASLEYADAVLIGWPEEDAPDLIAVTDEQYQEALGQVTLMEEYIDRFRTMEQQADIDGMTDTLIRITERVAHVRRIGVENSNGESQWRCAADVCTIWPRWAFMDSVIWCDQCFIAERFRHHEAATSPKACFLRVDVVSTVASVINRVESVIRFAPKAANLANRVFNCPRRASHFTNDLTLPDNVHCFELKGRVSFAFCVEPTRATHSQISARRESHNENNAASSHCAAKNIPCCWMVDDMANAGDCAINVNAFRVLRVNQNCFVTCVNPRFCHYTSDVTQADDNSFAHNLFPPDNLYSSNSSWWDGMTFPPLHRQISTVCSVRPSKRPTSRQVKPCLAIML